jgi:hypothetical protein
VNAGLQRLDPRHAFPLNFELFNQARVVDTTPLAAFHALETLRTLRESTFFQQTQAQMPSCGCIPRPSVQQAGAPAGKGLTVGADGWPEGTVTTAGGYRIVPEGKTNWEIYAPGQKFSEKAHTRIWGDPHVDEGDGTRWDFTKSSDFVLPDGTRIHCETSADRGRSVSVGLEIVNGADRVSVSGLNGRDPDVSDVRHDGYQWRARHLAGAPDRDSFHLRGDEDTVHWVRERDGEMEGVITGAFYDRAQRRYEQRVDDGHMSFLAPEMRPPVGSPAWGNLLRGQLNDAVAKLLGQELGDQASWPAEQVAQRIAGDHLQAQFRTELQQQLFGGWVGTFDDMTTPYGTLNALVGLLKSESQWQDQLRFGWQQQHAWA